MSVIFRKVRKLKVSTAAIRHYLVYALGEILLIFIGITLAIWFNNRSQTISDKQTEQSILSGMSKDLAEASSWLEFQVEMAREMASRDSTLLYTEPQQLSVEQILEGYRRINLSKEPLADEAYLKLREFDQKGIISNPEISGLIDMFYGQTRRTIEWWIEYDVMQTFEAEKYFTFNDKVFLGALEMGNQTDFSAYRSELLDFHSDTKTLNFIYHDYRTKTQCALLLEHGLTQSINLRQEIDSFLDLK